MVRVMLLCSWFGLTVKRCVLPHDNCQTNSCRFRLSRAANSRHCQLLQAGDSPLLNKNSWRYTLSFSKDLLGDHDTGSTSSQNITRTTVAPSIAADKRVHHLEPQDPCELQMDISPKNLSFDTGVSFLQITHFAKPARPKRCAVYINIHRSPLYHFHSRRSRISAGLEGWE
jgi:hypothetical protein